MKTPMNTDDLNVVPAQAPERPNNIVLKLDSVTKTYRDGTDTVWACRDVNLTVLAAELVWLRGVSGAGKSTLLMAGAGLVAVDSGTITVGDSEYSNASAKDRARLRLTQVGIVFQDFLLVEEFTAEENVMLPLEAMGWSTTRARTEARAWLDTVGLSSMPGRRPSQLSGGQRQRVAIARALVGGKSLILADEPTGSLDSVTTSGIFALLRHLADNGVAVVAASHNHEFGSVADKTYDMKDGMLSLDQAPCEPE
jgi:putative ABC transport system ATP-binding protein